MHTRPMALVVAHRGGAGPHPENTLEALAFGAEAGADMVELDCQLSRDGVVVALHDVDLRRHWGVARPVVDLTWAEISLLRHRGYRLPRLADVLEGLPVPLMLDVPNPAVATACSVLTEGMGATGRCLLAGPALALANLREDHPGARLALTWERRGLAPPDILAGVEPEYFNPHWRVVTPGLVARAHASGLCVSTWTVNYPWLLRRVLRAGVDVVITDNVPLARRLACPRPEHDQDSSGG